MKLISQKVLFELTKSLTKQALKPMHTIQDIECIEYCSTLIISQTILKTLCDLYNTEVDEIDAFLNDIDYQVINEAIEAKKAI